MVTSFGFDGFLLVSCSPDVGGSWELGIILKLSKFNLVNLFIGTDRVFCSILLVGMVCELDTTITFWPILMVFFAPSGSFCFSAKGFVTIAWMSLIGFSNSLGGNSGFVGGKIMFWIMLILDWFEAVAWGVGCGDWAPFGLSFVRSLFSGSGSLTGFSFGLEACLK